jgi:hypothetical protein
MSCHMEASDALPWKQGMRLKLISKRTIQIQAPGLLPDQAPGLLPDPASGLLPDQAPGQLPVPPPLSVPTARKFPRHLLRLVPLRAVSNRLDSPTTCGASKANPGAFDTDTRTFFQLGPFNVGGPAGQVKCVTVTWASSCTNVFPVTYSPNFVPGSVTTNYLADPSTSFRAVTPVWSFNLTGGADFVLIFQQVTIGSAVVGCPLTVCIDIP